MYLSHQVGLCVCMCVLQGLWWFCAPGPSQPPVAELSPLSLSSSQVELVSMGFPQADVPLSTETGGPGGSPHVPDSIFWGPVYCSPQPGGGKRKEERP